MWFRTEVFLMALNVASIASEGLVYCSDPGDLGENPEKSTILEAMKNILEAQSFDSIPLRTEQGEVRKIARRRLHEGDPDEPVFILELDECATISNKANILSALFSILSNEHHILFVVGKNGDLEGVVTLSLIAQPVVRDYLRLKILELESRGWNWNSEYLGGMQRNLVTYADEIYGLICELAAMVDDEQPLPNDRLFSTKIVKLLIALQPLKNIGKPYNVEQYSLQPKSTKAVKETASELMTSPVACLNEANEHVLNKAFHLFAKENQWDFLVLKDKNGCPISLMSLDDDGPTYTKISKVGSQVKRLDLIRRLIKHDFKPLFCQIPETEKFGILTIEDLILDEVFIPNILKRIARLEHSTRTDCFQRNGLYLNSKRSGSILVSKVDWSAVIEEQNAELYEALTSLRNWRNLLVHSYLPLVGEKNLDVWMRHGFIEGLNNLEKCEQSFTEKETPKVYSSVFGLNEFLRQHQPQKNKPDFYARSCGLVKAEVDNDSTLHLYFSPKKLDFWKQNLKPSRRNLEVWTGCADLKIHVMKNSVKP